MKNLDELYCDVDDFCKVFIPQWQKQLLEDGSRLRQRDCRMSMSEIMTIIIGFHMSHDANIHNTKPVEELAAYVPDELYGDKGYLTKALKANLFDKGVTLKTYPYLLGIYSDAGLKRESIGVGSFACAADLNACSRQNGHTL